MGKSRPRWGKKPAKRQGETAAPSAREQIAAILERLDDPHKAYGRFIASAAWNRKPSAHPQPGKPHVTYKQPESLAEIWRDQLGILRRWVQAEGDLGAGEPELKAARWLLQFGIYLPRRKGLRKGLPSGLARDVSDLDSLVRILSPAECATCSGEFVPGRPDERHCPTCKTNRGNYGEISTALHCYWHHRQQIRLSNPADWDDFRAAFFKQYGTLPEEAAKEWTPIPQVAPSDQSPPLWKQFELDCRERVLAAGASRDHWQSALHRTPIAEVVKWIRAEPLPAEPAAAAPAPAVSPDDSASVPANKRDWRDRLDFTNLPNREAVRGIVGLGVRDSRGGSPLTSADMARIVNAESIYGQRQRIEAAIHATPTLAAPAGAPAPSMESKSAEDSRTSGELADDAALGPAMFGRGRAAGRRPKTTVNARMFDKIAKQSESKTWSARQWAEALGCAKATIIGCPVWKKLAELRTQTKAEAALEKATKAERRGRRA